MKIFLDTAERSAIEPWIETGIIDGVTTNPSNLSRLGGDPREHINLLLQLLPEKIISVEVTETEPKAVYKQAHAIAKLSPYIAVKVPCHKDYYRVIKSLVSDGVRLNITLVFSVIQALTMAKIGVAYISPFLGRLEESGGNGFGLLVTIRDMIDHYNYSTQILAASIRNINHFEQAIIAGADCITLSEVLLEEVLSSVLVDQGMEKFKNDWKKLGNIPFP
jgi:transaldolase